MLGTMSQSSGQRRFSLMEDTIKKNKKGWMHMGDLDVRSLRFATGKQPEQSQWPGPRRGG